MLLLEERRDDGFLIVNCCSSLIIWQLRVSRDMETSGRIVATPDALDFTVENVEKVSFDTVQSVAMNRQLAKHGGFAGIEGRHRSSVRSVATVIAFLLLEDFTQRIDVAARSTQIASRPKCVTLWVVTFNEDKIGPKIGPSNRREAGGPIPCHHSPRQHTQPCNAFKGLVWFKI